MNIRPKSSCSGATDLMFSCSGAADIAEIGDRVSDLAMEKGKTLGVRYCLIYIFEVQL